MAAVEKGDSKKYHHGKVRQRSLDEGLVLLKARGVEHFSLRELARHIGVTPTAIYHHFPDKDDLLAELSMIGLREFQGKLASAVDHRTAPKDSILSLSKAYFAFFDEWPFFLDLLFSPAMGRYPLAASAREGTFELIVKVFGQLGIPAAKAPVMALWAWAAVHGMVTFIKSGMVCPPGQTPPDLTEAAQSDMFSLFAMDRDQLLRVALPALSSLFEQYAKGISGLH